MTWDEEGIEQAICTVSKYTTEEASVLVMWYFSEIIWARRQVLCSEWPSSFSLENLPSKRNIDTQQCATRPGKEPGREHTFKKQEVDRVGHVNLERLPQIPLPHFES